MQTGILVKNQGASALRAGPGYTLQFLGFTSGKACGISASIPCAASRSGQVSFRGKIRVFC
jgi:hypothetical protein